ncbi:rhodanese-like domain-containing protein [Streptomyces venezuelae]|uniref:rhodanese-like domain-containing protein n=1 Tax=Streptomyces venezuelae TaxID=54571 RepID=UPI0037892420
MFLFRRGQSRVDADRPHSRTNGDLPDTFPPHSGETVGDLPTEATGEAMAVISRSGHPSRSAVKLPARRVQEAVDIRGGGTQPWAAAHHPSSTGAGRAAR